MSAAAQMAFARKRAWVHRPAIVFLVFAAAYLVTWAGHLDSGDSSYRIAWAKAMLFHHSARIDSFGLGASYCKYAIGHSILAMPFLYAAEVLRRVTHIRAEGPVYMLLFVLNAAAFMALVARYLRERFDEATTRRALILIGFCTVWLPCSRMDSIEQLTLTFLFAGFLLVKRGRVIPGMLLASISVTIRPDSLVPVAMLALWHWWPRRSLRTAILLGVCFVPALLVNAAANWSRWGTIFEAGYAGEPFSEPALFGLYGILFSAGKSILIYSPPLLLGIWAAARKKHRDYIFFGTVLLSEIALYSCWWDWSGDDCWGVRFLNPGVMLMCLPAAEMLRGLRWPRFAMAMALTGFAVQMLATVVDPMAADYAVRNYAMKRVALYPGQPTGGTNRVDMEDLRFNPRYSPLSTDWLMLRALLHRLPAQELNPREIARTGTPLYDALLAGGWDPRAVRCDLFWISLAGGRH